MSWKDDTGLKDEDFEDINTLLNYTSDLRGFDFDRISIPLKDKDEVPEIEKALNFDNEQEFESDLGTSKKSGEENVDVS